VSSTVRCASTILLQMEVVHMNIEPTTLPETFLLQLNTVASYSFCKDEC